MSVLPAPTFQFLFTLSPLVCDLQNADSPPQAFIIIIKSVATA